MNDRVIAINIYVYGSDAKPMYAAQVPATPEPTADFITGGAVLVKHNHRMELFAPGTWTRVTFEEVTSTP